MVPFWLNKDWRCALNFGNTANNYPTGIKMTMLKWFIMKLESNITTHWKIFLLNQVFQNHITEMEPNLLFTVEFSRQDLQREKMQYIPITEALLLRILANHFLLQDIPFLWSQGFVLFLIPQFWLGSIQVLSIPSGRWISWLALIYMKKS